jgi:UrcA family protein
MTIRTASLAASIALAVATSALADTVDVGGIQYKSAVVSYADLDVAKIAGAAALLYRIKAAAHEVCGPRPYILDLSGQRSYGDCVSTAIRNAVDAMHSPMLSSVYKGAPLSVIAQNAAPADPAR